MNTSACAGLCTEKCIRKSEHTLLNAASFLTQEQHFKKQMGLFLTMEIANGHNKWLRIILMKATPFSWLPSCYLHSCLWKNVNCYANLSINIHQQNNVCALLSLYRHCLLFPPLDFYLYSIFFLLLAFWKAVSLNPIEFPSAWGSFKAPLRGQARRSSHPPPGCLREQKHSSAVS